MRTVNLKATLISPDDIKNMNPKDPIRIKILNEFYDINTEDQCWFDYLEDQSLEELNQKGFYNIKHQFTGFSSQGDGARILCSINGKDAVKLLNIKFNKQIQKHIDSEDIELATIEVYAADYGYYHHNTLDAQWKNFNNSGYCENVDDLNLKSNLIETLENTLDDMMSEILEYIKDKSIEYYRNLENLYYILTSEDEIFNTLKDLDFEFFHNGDTFKENLFDCEIKQENL